MISRIILVCSSALVLVACSGSNQPAPAQTTGPDGIIADATPPMAMASASASGFADAAAASASAASADGIPLSLRGRWGINANDCTPGRADAKGLMTVSATSIKFYESIADLGKTRDRSETMLRGSYAFSGEGISWKRDITLTLATDGKALVKLETGQDAPPGSLTYTRCS